MKTQVLSTGDAETWFPCDDNGCNVQPSAIAVEFACRELSCSAADLQWHTPDVFSIRYGSSYVATARSKAGSVRFVSDEGDFVDSDVSGKFASV